MRKDAGSRGMLWLVLSAAFILTVLPGSRTWAEPAIAVTVIAVATIGAHLLFASSQAREGDE